MACYGLRSVHDKTIWCDIRRTFDPVVAANVGCTPISSKDESRLHPLVKKMPPGILMVFSYEREEGQETCSSWNAKTWQTCQPPKFTRKKFKHREVSQEGTLSFPCSYGSLSLSLSNSSIYFEQDEQEEVEETSFEEDSGTHFSSVSGDFMHRHHELHAQKCTSPVEETIPIPSE